MKNLLHVIRSHKIYILVLLILFVGFAIIESINKRFWLHDFQVYYDAASAFFSGNTVYGVSFGLSSGFYKYSPFGLFIFFPLTLLPYAGAKLIYFVFLSLLIIVTVILANLLINNKLLDQKDERPRLLVLFLITIAFLQHIYFELHLGNINIFLLFLSLLSLRFILNKKEIVAGFLIAFAILIKPHFLLLLPLLIIRKRFISLGSCIAGLITGLLLPSLYVGYRANVELLIQWKNAMLMHNDSPVKGQDTIYSWIYRLAGSFINIDNQRLFVIVILALIAMLMFAFIISNWQKEAKASNNNGLEEKHFLFEFVILVALIPNLTVTDSEHFLFSVPLLAWVINFLFVKKPGYIFACVVILILFLYGGNLRELVGKQASRWMTDTGILGLGNMLLIAFSIFLMKYNPSQQKMAEAVGTDI